MSQRKIIHIDMDAFYASVEQRDNPELKGKPIAVGGLPENRGVVATASYEARTFGVRSAMPSKRAIQICPELIFIAPRFDVYKSVSDHVREIFYRYTDLIEPLSLDEAYLDVTEDKQQIGSAIGIARQIKTAIREELQLTASAGVSINKFVAKIASDMNKPDGLTFIPPDKVESFMESLPVNKFYGVGKVTAEKMNTLNLFTGADLKKLSEVELIRLFGKQGSFYFKIVRGVDDRPVEPNRETKSISAEDTFLNDLSNPAEMKEHLDRLAAIVADRLQEYEFKGRTITLKIRYSDFKTLTRSQTLPAAISDHETIADTALQLLLKTDIQDAKIRLLGIGVSNIVDESEPPANRQLRLF
ncbi:MULTISPECIES: DNA polymerase IV [Niastella]|uniref:DNA polymerase IV n=1 Tax=Niastella soli TaxID=2821487 RepID=A0ABS3YWY7_9BACT|nr:DNA polymerase IV [Niastella soli]MBO9202444.1 DNA polymerase IV [Niastella soli]